MTGSVYGHIVLRFSGPFGCDGSIVFSLSFVELLGSDDSLAVQAFDTSESLFRHL